jgi:1-acyl-sn-glycerol-3-phosphate acyltransferase
VSLAAPVLRSLLFAVVFYGGTALLLVLCSPLLLGPRAWAMAGLRAHARASLWALRVIVGTKIEVRGHARLPPAPFLVASKHQSAWDTFALVPLFRDPAFVMKAELGLIPLYGWFSIKFGHILVRRGRAAAALKALIRDARTRAGQNREILIFPEGTRRAPGATPDYKSGVVALYEGLGLPCVPVALNSGLFWPRRQLLRYPGTIVVEILEPLPPNMSRPEFKRQIQSRIEEASNRLLLEAGNPAGAAPVAPGSASIAPAIDKTRT